MPATISNAINDDVLNKQTPDSTPRTTLQNPVQHKGEWLLFLDLTRIEPDYELLRDYVDDKFETLEEYREVERLLLDAPFARETIHDLLNDLEPEEHPELRRAWIFLRMYLAIQPEVQKLIDYIAKLCISDEIDATTASKAWEIWKRVSSAVDYHLSVPDAGAGPDRQLLFTWNKGEHHLEIEVFPSGPVEFFYYNRLTEETWEEEYMLDNPISEEARLRLRLFILNQ